MAQANFAVCQSTLAAYRQSENLAIAQTSNYCTQAVMDAMMAFYIACNQSGLQLSFSTEDSNYQDPATFQTYCLSHYNVALQATGLPAVLASAVPSTTTAVVATTAAAVKTTTTTSAAGNTDYYSSSCDGCGPITGGGAAVLVFLGLIYVWFRIVKARRDAAMAAVGGGVRQYQESGGVYPPPPGVAMQMNQPQQVQRGGRYGGPVLYAASGEPQGVQYVHPGADVAPVAAAGYGNHATAVHIPERVGEEGAAPPAYEYGIEH
ncbi:hypothetical protein HDU98_004207 [Podochytrium sp. JEL0797]|nr:hypothetical protein HDU98_004207 [Podochytrium sp. JEL0797]